MKSTVQRRSHRPRIRPAESPKADLVSFAIYTYPLVADRTENNQAKRDIEKLISFAEQSFGRHPADILDFTVLANVRRATEDICRRLRDLEDRFGENKNPATHAKRQAIMRDWRKVWGISSQLERLKFKTSFGKTIFHPLIERFIEQVKASQPITREDLISIMEKEHDVVISARKKQKRKSSVETLLDDSIKKMALLGIANQTMAEFLGRSVRAFNIPAPIRLNDPPAVRPLVITSKALMQRIRRLSSRSQIRHK